MHIRPTTGRPASAHRSSRAGSSATAQPPFCGSSPILTWTKQSGRRPALRHRLGERGDQRRPVDRMDRVEQGDRLLGLVRLELADQVQADVGMALAQRRPLGLRLLHPILAEIALARRRSAPRSPRRAGSWRRRSGSRRPGSRPASARRLAIRPGPRRAVRCAPSAAAIGSAMHRRQPLPRLWLMTDERQGDGLLAALARLPAGAGIVFRHYSLPEAARRALFDRVADARITACCCSPAPPAQARAGAPTAATAAARAPASEARRSTISCGDPRRRARRRRLALPLAGLPTRSHPGRAAARASPASPGSRGARRCR